MSTGADLPVVGHLIAGRSIEDSAQRSPVFDPATGRKQKEVVLADPALVAQAVEDRKSVV